MNAMVRVTILSDVTIGLKSRSATLLERQWTAIQGF